MASRLIIEGRDDGSFDGEAFITRAEFAAILLRALGLPTEGDGSVFRDVPAEAWYSGVVGAAYEAGLVSGKGNGLFDPKASITRQEAMMMLFNAARLAAYDGKAGSLDRFSDEDSIKDWAREAAQWNVGSGLIQGNDQGQISGGDNITRGETATVILRLLQQAGLVDIRTKA